MKGTCQYCGKDCKNVGSHERWCKERIQKELVIVDEYLPEKPLSSIISEIKQVLKQYQKQIVVTTIERNGSTEEIEIIARIQLRR